jgi:hypothetical protein
MSALALPSLMSTFNDDKVLLLRASVPPVMCQGHPRICAKQDLQIAGDSVQS